jgi:UDP-N-acetylglucosamine transferase subunit ALG13
MGWISEAQFVISQGGFGSIRDCLEMNKPVLAVPRLPEYGECIDSQKEVVEALEDEGRIVALYDIARFDSAIDAVRQFTPSPRPSSGIPELVAGLIADYTGGVRGEHSDGSDC